MLLSPLTKCLGPKAEKVPRDHSLGGGGMKQIKVVIVDDKEVFREGLARLLEDQDHIDVVCRCGSKEVVRKVQQSDPDLVLMDTELSDRDVIEVIPQITESSPKVKVAMFSDSADREKLFSCVEVGAKGYLVKSLSVDDLVKSIDLIAEGRVVISPLLSDRFVAEFSKLREKERSRVAEGPSDVSEREKEILKLVAKGYTNKEISQKLVIAENTAKVHVKNILIKLELRNRQQAAAYAAEHGLIGEAGDVENGNENEE